MKIAKNKKVIFIISIIIIALIASIFVIAYNKTKKSDSKIAEIKEEIPELFSYFVYDNQDTNNLKVLVNVESTDGIEYVEYSGKEGNTNRITANGKTKVSIDYTCAKDTDNIFRVKEVGKEEVTKNVLTTDEGISNSTLSLNKELGQGYKNIKIENNIDLPDFELSYKIGENGEWIKSSDTFSFLDYDVTQNGLTNSDNTITCYAKVENTKNNYKTEIKENYTVDTSNTTNSVTSESLIKAVEDYNGKNGNLKVSVNGEDYSLQMYIFDGNQTFNTNMTFGTEADVATSTENAKNMIVVKVNGDLEIGQGATITPYASKDGYGGPKGMFIYCTGTLTNNGTISMTARGAKAEGQNVYLLKNSDGTYEYVPAVGALGSQKNAIKGADGSDRTTGGGGAGRNNYDGNTGKGSNGTSYSGGTGGGGTGWSSSGDKGYVASANGGAGGIGTAGNSNGYELGGGRSWKPRRTWRRPEHMLIR